jgi:hypothetical protein
VRTLLGKQKGNKFEFLKLQEGCIQYHYSGVEESWKTQKKVIEMLLAVSGLLC